MILFRLALLCVGCFVCVGWTLGSGLTFRHDLKPGGLFALSQISRKVLYGSFGVLPWYVKPSREAPRRRRAKSIGMPRISLT